MTDLEQRDDLLKDYPLNPTQKDVARLAGVSPVTVSRTLAGGKNVRADVQERVLEAVRLLDYLPNENARSLRPGQNSGLVGVAITSLSNPYYGNFALGVEEVANEMGRFILLGSTGESAERERQLIANFISRQVEGLIVIPAGEPTQHQWAQRLGDIPLVLASREIADVPVDTVLVDDFHAAYTASKELIAAGHRRIGFIGNIESVSAHRERFHGLKQALDEAGLPLDESLVKGVFNEVDDAAAITRGYLDCGNPPSVILCANNRLTVGLLLAFAERIKGGEAPSDLPEVVCFDGLELAELMPVPVKVVAHDARELGREAARMLFDRLDGDAAGEPARKRVLEARIS